MELDKQTLQDILWERTDETGRYEKIETEIVDTSRWSVHHMLYFRDVQENKCYSIPYSVGATEYQDETPFEYGPWDCDEVRQVEKVVKVWERVND